MRSVGFIFLPFLLFLFIAPGLVSADSLSIDAISDWESGTFDNARLVQSEIGVELSADGSWNALTWKTPDKTLGAGASFTSDGTFIYVIRGQGDILFSRYDYDTDSWESLENLPFAAYLGADVQYFDGYVYALFGAYQKSFARYSIADDQWELLHDFPEFTWQGTSLTADDTYIYAATGNSSQNFYRYSVGGDSWTLRASTPAALRAGADLIRVGSYIYTPAGNNTTAFYRYTISSNTWDSRAVLPATINGDTDVTSDGTYIYVSRQNNTANFYRYDIGGNSWISIANAPMNSQYGGVQYLAADGYVYFFRGNSDYRFWKYKRVDDKFIGPANALNTLSTGSDMIFYSGNMYVLRGTNTLSLYQYSVSGNSWSPLLDAPAGMTFNDYTRGTVVGSNLYFFVGSNTTNFLRYLTGSNTWETLATSPAAVRFGGALAYPGSGNYLFATRGAGTSAFWRYDVVGDTWDDAAATDLPTGVAASYGSALVSDGTDLYFFPSNGLKRLYKFDVSENTWTDIGSLPFTLTYGSDVTYDDGRLIALEGNYSRNIWQYDISDEEWIMLNPFAAYGPTEVGAWSGASVESDGNGNYYEGFGNGSYDILVFAQGDSNYNSSGTWVSPRYDLKYVSGWTSISTVETTPDDSSVVLETRSSADGEDWSAWEVLSGGAIASAPQRFFQLKASLIASSDQVETPVLHKIEVSYVADSTPPGSPTEFEAYSQEVGGVELVEGLSYSFSHPYFTWDASIDDETWVDGYYVYWGANEAADPLQDGIFQEETTFSPNHGIDDGMNYLRVCSVDALGNSSAPETYFEFEYSGVAPLKSLVVDDADFLGITEGSEIVDSKLSLEHIEGGFWRESRFSQPTRGLGYGARSVAYVPSLSSIYVLTGQNNRFFMRYDIALDSWSDLALSPSEVYYGGGVVEGPTGYLYSLKGMNTVDFWRYSIDTNAWDTGVASAPLTVSYGSSMIFDGTQYLYVLRGNNSDVFWRYDTFMDSWENLAKTDFGFPDSAMTNNVYIGGDLAFDSAHRLLYAIQGNFNTGFSVYNLDTDSWSPLGVLPGFPSYGASIEYYAPTNSIFYTPGDYRTFFYRYDVSTQEWSELSPLPMGFYYGGGLHVCGNDIYGIRGAASTLFYKYDMEDNSWYLPTRGVFSTLFEGSTLLTASYGAEIVKGDGSNYYITRGNMDDLFLRWNENTGEITYLENVPTGMYVGGSLAYDSVQSKIYATAGIYDRSFYIYDVASNTWTKDALDSVPVTPNSGSSMVFDGVRYVYLAVGGGSAAFYQYDPLGTPGTKWIAKQNVSGTLNYGAELLYDNGLIYTLRGSNVTPNPLYRYTVGTNTWDSLASLTSQVYNDGFLVDGGNGIFYASRGSNTSEFYAYSLSSNQWSSLPSFPGQIYTGGSGESNGQDSIYVIPGAGTNTYADGIYTFIYETSESSYISEGTYQSQAHDLTEVYRWAGVTVEYEKKANSSLVLETSTSSDGVTWSDWVEASRETELPSGYNYRINSTPSRFIKVKFTLESGDGRYSPSISQYSIDYYQDVTAPENPDLEGFYAYKEYGSSDEIVSELWYNHDSPYFDWVESETEFGAKDGESGSGVAGYQVYWGTEADAIPSEDGDYIQEDEYSPASVEDGSVYYLLIQTVDRAGNFSDEVWNPFIYKYDASAPSAITNLVADPSGYTAVDSFSFTWDAASSEGAPVDVYCFKTGATSGEFSVDQCISETTFSSIPSYKIGQNTFLVRAVDLAGNYTEYATVGYFFVDLAHAPAPPTELTVTPESNTMNVFGFDWEPPLVGTFFGSQANLSYYYSVNALPSQFSTSATSLTYLNPGAYATLPGENTFYIVTKDEAGNIDYSDFVSISFYANTVAPGIPVDLEIADVSVKSTSSWKLAVSWEPPLAEGSGVAGYEVHRSIDGEDFYFNSYTSGSSYVDSKLLQITYYYKIRACDSTNNCGAFSSVVSMYPDGRYVMPAEIIVDPIVSEISPKKATVSWVTARTADSKIAYGLEPGVYFDAEVSNSDQVVDHILTLTNLAPGTTYYYVVKWTDEDGNTGITEESYFRTSPPPSIQEPVVKRVGLDSALIEFITKDSLKVRVYYGESSAFGGIVEVYTGAQEGTHYVELTNLKHGTKYFYKINTVDIDEAEYEGELHSFETLPRPQILDSKIFQVKGTSMTTLLVEWNVNTPVSSVVTYFPSAQPERALDEVNVALKGGLHRMVLLGLDANTLYTIIISGRDFMGNEASSGTLSFTTASDTRAPIISDFEVVSEIIGSGQEASAQLVVSYKTDEMSTAQVEYGEGTGTAYAQKTQEDRTLSENHIIIISGLTPSKVYHLRAISKDGEGNEGYSIDKVIVTNPSSEDAYNLVINNLASIFSFLDNVR